MPTRAACDDRMGCTAGCGSPHCTGNRGRSKSDRFDLAQQKSNLLIVPPLLSPWISGQFLWFLRRFPSRCVGNIRGTRRDREVPPNHGACESRRHDLCHHSRAAQHQAAAELRQLAAQRFQRLARTIRNPRRPIADHWIDFNDPRVISSRLTTVTGGGSSAIPRSTRLVQQTYPGNLPLQSQGQRVLEFRARFTIALNGASFPRPSRSTGSIAGSRSAKTYRRRVVADPGVRLVEHRPELGQVSMCGGATGAASK